jgi:hypothetical protein
LTDPEAIEMVCSACLDELLEGDDTVDDEEGEYYEDEEPDYVAEDRGEDKEESRSQPSTYDNYPWSLLGVTSDVGPNELKVAYRNKARAYHPDMHKGDPHMEEAFKELQKAYNVAKDILGAE